MERVLASLPQTPSVQTPCAGVAQLTQEQLALLGASDSECEIEEVAVPAQIAERPVVYKTATAKICEGPVGKYSRESLSEAAPATLLQDAMLVDNPQAYCGSFKRLRKKTRVAPVKKVGRALKQLSTNSFTGGVDRAVELWAEACHGYSSEKLPRKSSWTRIKHNSKRIALRSALRRLSEGSCAKATGAQVQAEVTRVLEACSDDTSPGNFGLFLLAAAQRHMYNHRGCKVVRLPLPRGQSFDSKSQEKTFVIKSAPGFLCTLWTRLHEEPEVQMVILAAQTDDELVMALERCSKVRLFFAQYVDGLKELAKRKKWPGLAVKLEVGLLSKERGHMHLHVYLGGNPAGSCHPGGDETWPNVELDASDLAIGGGAVNVRRVFSRNGRGVRKGLEGALYYVVAKKVGSLLTFTTTVLWQVGNRKLSREAACSRPV